jgi:SAM-dependent methyltransferase
MSPPPAEPPSAPEAKFDAYAENYLALHAKNITASGEEPSYFADYKVRCLERLLGGDFAEPVLDYGCGVGMLTERLSARWADVHGFDPSPDSVAQARGRAAQATFHHQRELLPAAYFGVVVLANVLHHVPPPERPALIQFVATRLRPGSGRLVVFEHNPLNPLTRRAVATCEFDDDAILLWPGELRRLLADNALTRVERRFIVFFPRFLAALRWSEPYLGWLPLGAQMMVVGRAGAEHPGQAAGK